MNDYKIRKATTDDLPTIMRLMRNNAKQRQLDTMACRLSGSGNR